MHPNGKQIFTARIIPFRGSWIEFTTDINDVLYVYIDRRKKFPATTLLRALGHATDRDILRLFDYIEEVPLTRKDLQKEFGRPFAADVVNEATGEVLFQSGAEFNEEALKTLVAAKVTRGGTAARAQARRDLRHPAQHAEQGQVDESRTARWK